MQLLCRCRVGGRGFWETAAAHLRIPFQLFNDDNDDNDDYLYPGSGAENTVITVISSFSGLIRTAQDAPLR